MNAESKHPSKSPRGVALLIVLATLILVATATTILVGAAASAKTQRKLDRCCDIADDLLSASGQPIQKWLATKSDNIVLSVDVRSPQVVVLHECLHINDVDCELIITAFDQCGMVPIEFVQNGSPLRQAVPQEIVKRVDALALKHDALDMIGLDLFVSTTDADQPTPFPRPFVSQPVSFGSFLQSDNAPNTARDVDERELGLGEVIATHNGKPSGINVNTAPMNVLEAELQMAQRGGLDQIMAARSDGKLANVGSQVSSRNSLDPELAPRLVNSSESWSFRIDANVGPLRKSWWAIYRPAKDAQSHSASSRQFQWKCVQRLVISY